MAKDKRSFFERLTGTVRVDEDTVPVATNGRNGNGHGNGTNGHSSKHLSVGSGSSVGLGDDENWNTPLEEQEAELTVDVYQTPDMIVVKSMIAGVRPDDLDVNITRDMVTIRGKREEERIAKEDDYFVKELYWGAFSRTISLPEEVDVDEAEAIEKHGLLILKLPKLDKKKQSKLKVRTI